jgi:hypothetical protein
MVSCGAGLALTMMRFMNLDIEGVMARFGHRVDGLEQKLVMRQDGSLKSKQDEYQRGDVLARRVRAAVLNLSR